MKDKIKCGICRGLITGAQLVIEGVTLCDGCAADVCTLKKRLGGTRNPLVHKGHCCIIHGCKYGYDDCVVVTGNVVQEFPCEDCREESTELQSTLGPPVAEVKQAQREEEFERWFEKKLNDPKFVSKLKSALSTRKRGK